jgi:hypothetical protein
LDVVLLVVEEGVQVRGVDVGDVEEDFADVA